jgi:hypothetical protein
MTRWEYACLYIRENGDERGRWVLFSHQQPPTLFDRVPCDRDRSSPTRLEADAAGTLELLGALGEEGWELTSALRVDAVAADCLYFKRPLTEPRQRYSPQ